MKKFLITFFFMLLTAALSFIGVIVYTYYTAEEDLVLQPEISLAGNQILPDSYQWREALLGGLTHRDFSSPYGQEIVSVGKIQGNVLEVALPKDYDSQLTVRRVDGAAQEETLFEGSVEEYRGFFFQKSGSYQLDITLAKAKEAGKSFGQYHYRIAAEIELPLKLIHSKPEVVQGDVFGIELQNVPDGVTPTAETEISKVTFVKRGERQVAFIPIAYTRAPGEYTVTVTCGDHSEKVILEVVDGTFEEQHMTIDTSNPVISEANSPAAYQQYRDAIYPLYEEADPTLYWSGNFIQPIEGSYRVSTPYGIKRFTNGSKKATRHAGVDMAAPTGTPVRAPAAGRVVFAEYLLNTGNTVVIEHGAGLKTFYFHMDSLSTSAGETLTQGQLIGAVGTTGYSTGPHLHFEMRMANQAIDPGYLMNGSGGFFSLPE